LEYSEDNSFLIRANFGYFTGIVSRMVYRLLRIERPVSEPD